MCRVATREFEASPRSVPDARHWVAGRLGHWDVPGVSDVAQLLVTELMSNAVRHGSGRPLVSVSVAESCIEVGVTDTDRVLPHPPNHPSGEWADASQTNQGGRGMHIVDSLATEWGTTTLKTGKCVWFQLNVNDWSYAPSCVCQGDTGLLESGHRSVAMPGPWDD